jgi:uncharacterized membrane protein YgdD (TMEM256/DUF423 family)
MNAHGGARRWIALGALAAAAAVGLGAFGAHALRERLGESGRVTWNTAVQYHAWHALALILVGLLAERGWRVSFSGWAFALGSLCFSGSLYALALDGPRWLGPVTPLGGTLFLAGWLALAWRARPR